MHRKQIERITKNINIHKKYKMASTSIPVTTEHTSLQKGGGRGHDNHHYTHHHHEHHGNGDDCTKDDDDDDENQESGME